MRKAVFCEPTKMYINISLPTTLTCHNIINEKIGTGFARKINKMSLQSVNILGVPVLWKMWYQQGKHFLYRICYCKKQTLQTITKFCYLFDDKVNWFVNCSSV